MKVVGFVLCFWLALPFQGAAAPVGGSPIDSLQRLLAVAHPDTVRVNLLIELAAELTQVDPLATIAYGRQALQLAQQAGYVRGQSMALVRLGSGFREAGNYPAALQFGLKGLHLAEQLNNQALIARALNALGYLNWEQGNSRAALFYLQRARAVAERSHVDVVLTRVLGNIGNVYQQLHQPDSALFYSRQGLALDLRNHDLSSEVGDAAMLGNIYASLGNLPLAERYYRYSLRRAQGAGFTFALCRAYLGQARLFYSAARPGDSALYFARQALITARQGNYPRGQFDAAQFLATALAARHDTAAAFRYLRLANATRDTLFSATKLSQMQALDVSERMRLSELDLVRTQATIHRRQGWLLAALAAVLPALALLGYYGRQRQRANQLLNARNAELETQREELRATLVRLEETQVQLVQREKMAFLGELTAGIAHELQNPLAFVQNFAEVSALLVDDMAGEGATPAAADNGHELLLTGLKRNLREISEHGQRATSIIASMLARSRGAAAAHTLTDLNALALEYLRMAYQGLLANDKSFVAVRNTHLGEHLPPVAVVAPDLGRVLLNLFTNAFYAVQQRQQRGEPGYTPTISLRTILLPSGHVEIRVRDNGLGIPAAVQADIFQPFFTTKPAGEGTGLGLALAHDIVVRDHGGTLTVDSCENEFTEFSICLPGPAPQ